ncbi:hypothetical protein PYW07_016530 [Mythimna separata]|uniref:Homeobox domain-containing protein n=1 Tax=Mythimna separata TaxID=271217 RepID=A0AAD7YKP6_MYTSE|nr:hypothetical protein PYW07_016530 [Mythimna separata]
MNDLRHDSPKKVKRFRSAFTTDQVNYLEQQFKKFPYIGNAQRKEVAAALNIAERAVKIWFQNRRMKEKKENTTKENDDEQGIRMSLEFNKDQLNNVTTPSANEQPRSLPILAHLRQESCYNNNIETITSTKQSVETKDTAEPVTCSAVTPNVVTTAKVIHPPSVFVKSRPSSPEVKTSAEFSIELCKKYKSESLAKSPKAEVQKFEKEPERIKKLEEPKSERSIEQMTPEDLSLSRKMNMTTIDPQPTVPVNPPSNPGFVSLVPAVSPFYTQPYISASGVIWKPLNVLPVVTSSSPPVSAPNTPLLNMSPVQATAKRPCNCDCHVSQVMPQVPYTFTQQSPSPQYIITAVPFQNTSTKF